MPGFGGTLLGITEDPAPERTAHVRPCAPVTPKPAPGCLGRLTRPPRPAQRPRLLANPRLWRLSAQAPEKTEVPR